MATLWQSFSLDRLADSFSMRLCAPSRTESWLKQAEVFWIKVGQQFELTEFACLMQSEDADQVELLSGLLYQTESSLKGRHFDNSIRAKIRSQAKGSQAI